MPMPYARLLSKSRAMNLLVGIQSKHLRRLRKVDAWTAF